MGIIVSAWAVGALGGAQVHGRLCESSPALEFTVLTGVMLVALGLAVLTFGGESGLLHGGGGGGGDDSGPSGSANRK